MRLKKRNRVDGVRNEVRAQAKPWGKYFYLCLLSGFVLWLFDLFLGEMFYFRADGLVVQDRVVLATQYDASVAELNVREGQRVATGMALATLRSQTVEENIAELSAEVARMMEQASQLEVRKQVIEATQPLVSRRAEVATAARREVDARRALFTQQDRLRRLQDELESLQARSTDEAEYRVIAADLPKQREAIAAAQSALNRLSESYAQGALRAPVDGVVGYLHVSLGSVVSKATPMMEIYTGSPYVLAYVPEGALYELAPGDQIDVDVGFETYEGVVRQIYPVSSALPKEYTDALRVPQRAPLARIEFLEEDRYPSLFAQTEVSAGGWPPRWLLRLLGTAQAAESRAAAETGALQVLPPDIQPEVSVVEVEQHVEQHVEPVFAPFTVQLIALPDRKKVERYAARLALDALQITPVQVSGEQRFALTWSAFETREAAETAAAKLGVDYWVRPTWKKAR